MTKSLLLFAALFGFYNLINAQAGNLDSSFGNNGIVLTNFGATSRVHSARSTFVLAGPEGTFYLIIETYFRQTIIARILSNGTMDTSYGDNGYSQRLNIGFAKAALQSDGKIVIAGLYSQDYPYYFALARYNTDGMIDSTFSNDGILTVNSQSGFTQAYAVAVQNDGKIAAVINNALLRYNADGTPDSAFSGDGIVTTDFGSGSNWASALTLQSDGKIVIAGGADVNGNTDFALARYNADGTLDTAFSKDGKQTLDFESYNDYASAVVMQGDGKIVVAGQTHVGFRTVFGLARLNADGSPDRTFSKDGKQTTSFEYREFNDTYARAVAVQSDGKIVLAGTREVPPVEEDYDMDFALARYNADGSLDSAFSEDGKQVIDLGNNSGASWMVLQNDEKIVVAGGIGEDFGLVRYRTDGDLDTTFSEDGKFVGFLPFSKTSYASSALQKDGKIVVAGTAATEFDESLCLARYNSNGTLDSSFSEDGKLIADSGAYAVNEHSVAVQNDGKIVVAWRLNDASLALERYNNDGTLDTAFAKDGKQSAAFENYIQFYSLFLQQDEKIVIACQSGDDFNLVRYNSDGTLDSAFASNTIPTTNFKFNNAAMQSDGKFVVAGHTYYGDINTYDFAIMRYSEDGTLDSSFSNDGIIITDFKAKYDEAFSVAFQKDGKIVVAGNSQSGNGNDFGNYNFSVARYDIDGTLDTAFSDDGKVTYHFDLAFDPDVYTVTKASSVAIQNDEKIVVAGNYNGNSAIIRLNKNGSVDSSFGTQGGQITKATPNANSINSIIIPGNELYAVGEGKDPEDVGVVAKYRLNNNSENIAPTVSIIKPANNQTLAGPTTLRLRAAASDADGSITKVEFYNGSTLLHAETDSPYTYTWIDVPVGTYAITAKATDNRGSVSTSEVVNITVAPNIAPTVSIINPANGANFTAGTNISLRAAAADPDGSISVVEFYNGNVLLGTQYFSPYTFKWMNISAGTYTITAKATDNLGLSATSAPVTIIVSDVLIVSSKPYSKNEKNASNSTLNVRVFPNPATQVINLQTQGLQPNKPATLSLISNAGIVLKNIHISNAAQTTQLNVSSLAKGVYTIKIISGNKILYKQFVKL